MHAWLRMMLGNVGDARDAGLIPGQRIPKGCMKNPVQYSCLKKSHDRQEPGGLPSTGFQRVEDRLEVT